MSRLDLSVSDRTTAENVARAASIRRELSRLSLLVLIAIATFLVTRGLAGNNRAMSLRDGEEWYRRGQQAVAAGRLDEAVEALRHAAVRNRSDREYVLALAAALSLKHDYEAARGVLLALRDSAPEDADVNLALARLSAQRDDVTEALRFYHNALYAPWPAELSDARRRVRFELIRFLLGHNQRARAVGELLAVSTDLPDRPDAHLQVARLFVDAGDAEHALDQFNAALRVEPDNNAALAGAGASAFQLGRYALARTYFRRASRDLDDVGTTRQITDLVLSRDPLATRIGTAERRRRLTANFEYARERLASCSSRAANNTPSDSVLGDEAEAYEQQLNATDTLEQDTVETGLDLMVRIAEYVVDRCAPATPLDRALILIGREHGVGER